MRRTWVVSLVLAAACAIGGSRSHSVEPRAIVIVTLDTTRADSLPAYGFRGVTTPAIDRLAREGTTFDNAGSVAPLTLTAHTSIFTGLYPPRHGVRDNLAPPLDVSHAAMAEVLRAEGFRTGAFVGSAVLRRDRGLARGFELYDDGTPPAGRTPPRRSAREVVDAASAWIGSLGQERFFLWVHLYDAHAPQTLPVQFRREYGDRYEGAIAYMDSQIARLLDALQQARRLEATAIVLAADHGESLGDHGEREHGLFVYESVLRVPLIVRAPGVRARRVSDLASLVDVFPTVVDLLGQRARSGSDGRSLLPAMRGQRLPERSVYAESMYAERFGWSPLRTIRDGRFKFIDAPRPELYDLVADRFEQRNLAAQRVPLAAAMRAKLEKTAAGSTRDDALPAPDVLRELAALGYVAPARTPASEGPDAARLDPKDYIHVFNQATRGRSTAAR
jgi:choline-sulfatase